MTPVRAKKNKNLSALTVGLIAILLFIRINPIYYVAQFVPVRHADAQTMPAIRRGDSNHSLLRCQRAISERIEVVSVPDIRFTGIPFKAFFATASHLPQIGTFNIFNKPVLSGTRRIALLRTLRL